MKRIEGKGKGFYFLELVERERSLTTSSGYKKFYGLKEMQHQLEIDYWRRTEASNHWVKRYFYNIDSNNNG